MKPAKKDNPFTPGTGHSPPLLAGRDEETELLARMLERMRSLRSKKQPKLARQPFPPIKIVGPRGVGKTTLLTWAERRAAKNGRILVIRCAYLDDDGHGGDPMQSMVNAMKKWPAKVFETLMEAGVSLPGGFGVNVKTDRPADTYEQLVANIVQAKPLLLLLDEVHHFDLRPLGRLLQVNQQLISQGMPLGMVLAGTPGLDSHLAKAKSTFITRSRDIYVNTLSDEATREALADPFRQLGVAVAPDALEAMAAQTDNYPFFIQLVGEEVWQEMATAGRAFVDAKMVKRIEEKARKRRRAIYSKAYDRLDGNDLLPYACQVMELLDGNGGKAPAGAIIKLLMDANPGVDRQRARDIRDGLREDGFIWTVDDETAPGIPSFFNYFRARQQEEAG